MKKRFIAFLLAMTTAVLAGCGSQGELEELNNLEALNSESAIKEDYKLSYADKQDMIYSQVVDRQLLDLTSLTEVDDNSIQQVVNYLDNVDAQLAGTYSGTEYAIDEAFTNYLLAEFQRTPFYWQRTQTIVRGMDAESRSIVVDVKYKTIDFDKTVKPASQIVLGEGAYHDKLAVRFERWINILSEKYNNYGDSNWESLYNEFVTYYGDPEIIIESQNEESLTTDIFMTGNQRTYQNMIDSESEQTGGELTVRYVLIPNYVLGINLGITCKHMYVLDYKLDKDLTAGMEIFTQEGYQTVTDSVYNLIYSYFQCIDESDYRGLYKLTYDFGKLDKYYEDMFETTYRKHGGFTISLFDITGTHITCGINISSKIRAKGSNMTFPSYTDRYLCELELIDGVLKVENMVLLSRTIEGEPIIDTEDADISGFGGIIDLSDDDKIAIEKLICDFSSLQLNGETNSQAFGLTVDTSISAGDLTDLKETMTSLSGARKVCWISNYQQGTSNYASVKVKELFQAGDNSIVEAQSVYDFINKGGKWYVYDYTVVSSVRLSTTNLATTNSLCLVSPGKVESYVSQITGSSSASVENLTDISYTIDHPEKKPVLKSGVEELGISKEVVMTDEDFEYYAERALESAGSDVNYAEFKDLITEYNTMANGAFNSSVVENEFKNIVDITWRKINNRYANDNERITEADSAKTTWDGVSALFIARHLSDDASVQREFSTLSERLADIISSCYSSLGR